MNHLASKFPYLISVLIITFQQENYIKEALDSVISQNFEGLQIVVSDDGSTDQTIKIVKSYVEKFPALVFLVESAKNTGITNNCNRGLAICSGKYLSILGGDDLMLPNKLKTQASYMESNIECAVCYHDMDVFDSCSGKTLHLFSKISKPKSGGMQEAIKYGTVNCASSTMYRMSATPKLGFNSELPVVSDWMFTIESLESGGQLNYIDMVLGRYRRHTDNVTNINSKFRSQGHLDILKTCAICIARHPRYLSEIIYRLSGIFRESRNLGGGTVYAKRLQVSFKLRASFKSIFELMIYYVSLKKIRL